MSLQQLEKADLSTSAVQHTVDRLYLSVTHSPANHTHLYDRLEASRSLEDIVHFMRWDGEQPPYYIFLEQWLDRVPASTRDYLREHVDIEINEQHSVHFNRMLAHLNQFVPSKSIFDQNRLDVLNYPFTAEVLTNEDYGYFVGVFFATEILHSKRAGQLMQALMQNGIEKSKLKYLEIHHDADEDHGLEVGEMMIKPILTEDPSKLASIRRGIAERSKRSEDFLNWYEENQFGKYLA